MSPSSKDQLSPATIQSSGVTGLSPLITPVATELQKGNSSGIASRGTRAYGRGTKTQGLYPVVGTLIAKIPPSLPNCSSTESRPTHHRRHREGEHLSKDLLYFLPDEGAKLSAVFFLLLLLNPFMHLRKQRETCLSLNLPEGK